MPDKSVEELLVFLLQVHQLLFILLSLFSELLTGLFFLLSLLQGLLFKCLCGLEHVLQLRLQTSQFNLVLLLILLKLCGLLLLQVLVCPEAAFE